MSRQLGLVLVVSVSLVGAMAAAGAGCGDFKGGGDGAPASGADGGGSSGDGGSSATADGGVLPEGDGGAGADASDASGSATDGAPVFGDSGAERDGGVSAGSTGPGPFGALPSGYCTTTANNCRYRQAIVWKGQSMCADLCEGDSSCLGGGLASEFHCVGASASVSGRCEPNDAAFTCVPGNDFVTGTKTLGACCTATHNAKNGEECVGGHCGQDGQSLNNPFFCTNVCAGIGDCPGNYACTDVGGYSVCTQNADPYTCR